METNKIYNENCLDTMAKMDDGVIDLVVTSPPYDDMRDYNGYSFEAKPIIKELCRVIKDGGAAVWVIGDQTKNFSETGSSFRQALEFVDNGMNLETMIWKKPSAGGCLGSNRLYGQVFEYMFVLFKGKPATTNLIEDRRNVKTSGKVNTCGSIGASGRPDNYRTIEKKEFGKRTNVWEYARQKQVGHPAPFPKQLASDHIISWSNPGEIVYDPFMGSGTTAIAAIENDRLYIGSEMSKEYCDLIQKNIEATTSPLPVK